MIVLKPSNVPTLFKNNTHDVLEPFPDSSFLLAAALKKTYEETEPPCPKWKETEE